MCEGHRSRDKQEFPGLAGESGSIWRAGRDSNPQPTDPKSVALSIELPARVAVFTPSLTGLLKKSLCGAGFPVCRPWMPHEWQAGKPAPHADCAYLALFQQPLTVGPRKEEGGPLEGGQLVRRNLGKIGPVRRTLAKSDGAPGRSRTCDPRLRRPLLYPLSYWRTLSPFAGPTVISS